jgi:hypothetical protein
MESRRIPMDKHDRHAEMVEGFFTQQQQIFDTSGQAMYAYLDDDCRICNIKFAKLLGYSSPDEWFNVKVNGSFPGAFVDENSQQTLVDAYQRAMEKMEGSSIHVTWKKKSGGTVSTKVILVPVVYQNQLFALHYIS